jgi:biopolymer transport protein ExbD
MDKRKLDIREVRVNIERLHIERPDDTVVIIADKLAPAGMLTQVMDQVRSGGIETVSIAAAPAD